MAYGFVGCVLDGAIGFYVAYGFVGCILDGAVVLDVGHYGVAGVLDGLGAGREEEAEDGGEDYDGKVVHYFHFFNLASTSSIGRREFILFRCSNASAADNGDRIP